ncbi:P-loop containing nucleoside triphosphate hydrolase protein [Mycena capillaripes]|nr:P-loop containing nucleoside triphosphate hydrolase protein [Mycena capillaripes]
MASSLWSRSSSGCIASTSRALGSRPSFSPNSRNLVLQLLRSATCRRSYAAGATQAAEVVSDTDRKGPSFMTLEGKITKQTLDAITVKPFKLVNMSPVQAEVLPLLPALAEPFDEANPNNVRDLLVRAKTGTGKTLAFLVPAIEARFKSIQDYVAGNNDTGNVGLAKTRFARRTVGTLVISPTRELATQIANEALRLTHNHQDFEVRLLTGGSSKRIQMRDWMKGRKDIVVATPGRLRDMLESEPDVKAAIAETSVLILDEADTLLDMGFREDIEDIKTFLPPVPQRQTLLFSATVSKEIQQVARSTLARNHKYINCVTNDTSPVHAHVEQYHTVLPSASAQLPHIMRLIAHDQLTNPGKSKVILFLPTTKMTQLTATLVNALSASTLPAGKNTRVYEIHSKRTQEKRSLVSDSFRNAKGGATVLITSDVSARGVDYPGVTRVIQVGIPGGREQYIHRVGRTGRAGTAGRGDLVLLPWEIGFVTWQLTDVPLKPLAVNELTDQTKELAAKFDENPAAFFGQDTRVGRSLFPVSVTPVVEEIERNIGTLVGRLDPEAIRETFMSLLGYYLAKSPELRVQKPIIVQGCQDWTTGACGLATPPYISVAFLQKLGLGDGRTKHFGKTTHSMPSYERTSNPNAPWIGRGKVANRGRETMPRWAEADEADADEDVDVSEYKSQRYRDVGTGYRGAPGKGRGYGAEFRGGFGGRTDRKGEFGIGLGLKGGPLGIDPSSAPPRGDRGGYRNDRGSGGGGYGARSGGFGGDRGSGGGYGGRSSGGSGGYGGGRGGRGGGQQDAGGRKYGLQ